MCIYAHLEELSGKQTTMGLIGVGKINPLASCPHLTQRGARDYSAP